jgi:hypothetical protein
MAHNPAMMAHSFRRYRANWKDEIDSAAQYRAMGEDEPNASGELAAMDEKHASFWEEQMRKIAIEPGPRLRTTDSART